MTFATRIIAVALLAGGLTLLPDVALAKGQKVLVTAFSGAKKKQLRDELIRALEKDGYEVIDDEKVSPGSSSKDIAKRADAKGADAVVTGEGVLKKSGWKLKLEVRSASDGTIVEETEMSAAVLPKLLNKISTSGASTLSSALDKAAPAEPKAKEKEAPPPKEEPKEEEKAEPEKEPEEEAAPKDDKEDKEAAKDDKRRPSPLDLGAGIRLFRRDLRYSQDVNENLRKYALPLGPSVFLRLAWYPAAHFTSGFVSNLGITGGYEQSFGASSELENDSKSYSTTLRAWSIGARLRLPFSAHEAGIGLRYGGQSFEIDGDKDPNASAASGAALTRDFVPDVSYKYIRPSADLRLGFGPITVGGSLGVRFVTSAGAIEGQAWFPEASVLAMDAEIFGGYAVAKDLFAIAGLGFTRYGYNMHSKPADLTSGRDVAGGAIDQYLAAHLGIEWRPGASRPSSDNARARGVLVGQR
jgi:hypothetical protein